jgi:transcriptional regulator with XRE-family HTH domain
MSPTKRTGKKLRKLREARGMSQAALAKGAEISEGYLLRLEAGRQDPTLGVLERLARALGVKVRTLIE